MPLSIKSVTELTGELQRNYLYKMVVEDYPSDLLSQYANAQPVLEGFDCVVLKGVWPERKNENIKLEWGGENVNFSGVDASNKEFSFEALVDKGAKVRDFFDACKDLTGNLDNNAAASRATSRLTLGCYLVDVDKKTVNDYRKLTYVKIDGVVQADIVKNGKELLKLTISGTWDFNERDISKRGKTI